MSALTGGSAFPRGEIHDQHAPPGHAYCRHIHAEEGMSLRDYFAAKALTALVIDIGTNRESDRYERACLHAYEIADLMLKARAS